MTQKPLFTSPQSAFGAGLIGVVVILIGISTFLMSEMTKSIRSEFDLRDNTLERMDTVESAIATYAANNNGNLPCPASRDASLSDDTFGISEEFASGTPNVSCTGTGTGTARVVSSAGASVRVRIGSVPTATLGLPQESAFDTWGNRFTYAMVEDFGDGFSAFSDTDTDKFIEILDGAGGSLHPNVSAASETVVGYVLLSHGENGFGAYNVTGAKNSGCSFSKVHERENCDGNNSIYVKKSLSLKNAADADLFDDLIRWKMYK